MPSRSNKQARAMAAAAHDPDIRRRLGIPKKVAKEYTEADAESGRLSKAMKGKKRAKHS